MNKKVVNGGKNTFAVIYYVGLVSWTLFLLLLSPFFLLSDIKTVLESGFASNSTDLALAAFFGLVFGISLLLPSLRRVYDKLPWLYPLVKIFILDVVILEVGQMILNYGYQVQNNARHVIFLLLMVVQVVVFRFAMCFYFYKRPVVNVQKGWE